MFVSKYFNIGNIMISHEIIITMLENDRFMFEVGLSLKRYCVKDFGNLSEEDIQANEESLKNPDNLYLLGLYQTCVGEICVITNASEKEGENITTLLFPKER